MHFLPQVFAVLLLLTVSGDAFFGNMCSIMTMTLPAQHLHKISGKWILQAAYTSSDNSNSSQTIENTTGGGGGQTEIVLSEDNQTVLFKTAKMVDQACVRHSVNFTTVGNVIQETSAGSTNEVDFIYSCEGCLLMRFSANTQDGKKPHLLLLFHKTATFPWSLERAGTQAECLGFRKHPKFTSAPGELCPEQSEATEA